MASIACPRCGDFAPLVPHGRVSWCERCVRAVNFDLTPVDDLRGWHGVRQTLALVKRLGPLRFAPWLYVGVAALGSVALLRFSGLSAGISTLLGVALHGFVGLWASTWLCHCLLDELETGRHDAGRALRASLASVPLLLVVTFVASTPPVVHQLLSGSDLPITTPGTFVRDLVMFGCAFVPALAAQGERSSLIAGYHSARLLRTAGSRLFAAALLYGLVYGAASLLVKVLLVELAVSHVFQTVEYLAWAKRIKLGDQLGTWLPAVLHPFQAAFLLLACLKLQRTLDD